MVDNVSSHQSLWWEIVFFVQKICYNLTVSVTLNYTLANFEPYTVISKSSDSLPAKPASNHLHLQWTWLCDHSPFELLFENHRHLKSLF